MLLDKWSPIRSTYVLSASYAQYVQRELERRGTTASPPTCIQRNALLQAVKTHTSRWLILSSPLRHAHAVTFWALTTKKKEKKKRGGGHRRAPAAAGRVWRPLCTRAARASRQPARESNELPMPGRTGVHQDFRCNRAFLGFQITSKSMLLMFFLTSFCENLVVIRIWISWN